MNGLTDLKGLILSFYQFINRIFYVRNISSVYRSIIVEVRYQIKFGQLKKPIELQKP